MRFALPAVARSVDATDLSDLTTAVRTGPAVWAEDGSLEIPFDRDLTDAEVAAVTNRLLTPDNKTERIRQILTDYLANPAPTTADDRVALRGIAGAVLAYFERTT